MVRGILFFVVVWAFVTFGIELFRMLTGKEKWELIKSMGYAAVMAVVALIVVVLMVAVF